MEQAKRRGLPKPDGELMTVSMLAREYSRTLCALEECATLNPADDIGSAKSDSREAALLDVEENLLNKAAHIELRTDRDLSDLVDLWSRSSGILTGDDVKPSDLIALNIFRHISNIRLIEG